MVKWEHSFNFCLLIYFVFSWQNCLPWFFLYFKAWIKYIKVLMTLRYTYTSLFFVMLLWVNTSLFNRKFYIKCCDLFKTLINCMIANEKYSQKLKYSGCKHFNRQTCWLINEKNTWWEIVSPKCYICKYR